MRIVMFYHSLVSDWNHGNAHFLRGIVSELLGRGHDVTVFEPVDGWSLKNLRQEHGEAPLRRFSLAYPGLTSQSYDLTALDLNDALSEADLVLVHEWNDHELVRRIGDHHRIHRKYVLLFHDTHHRVATDPQTMEQYDLTGYDGVLAYGKVLRDLYLMRAWARRAWTWHEAADTRIFRPVEADKHEGDLVWIGNWGDDERTAELREYLLEPVQRLGLRARVYGVRYPDHALTALERAGIEYGGWLANFDVPQVFARFRLTVHVPRRPYLRALPGIPTIRVFEALACGIPLVSAPWSDSEHLFKPGEDFLVATSGQAMSRHLKQLLDHRDDAAKIAAGGLRAIHSRHTCAHRVDELMRIVAEIQQKEISCAAV